MQSTSVNLVAEAIGRGIPLGEGDMLDTSLLADPAEGLSHSFKYVRMNIKYHNL
jgi:hypothetical protein